MSADLVPCHLGNGLALVAVQRLDGQPGMPQVGLAMVIDALASALVALCEAPLPVPSETLPVLEQRLAERLLAFEHLDAAWPKGRTAIDRTEIGRQREDALSGIVFLRDLIITVRAGTLADAAAPLRRLEVMAEEEPRPHALLAPLNARRLVASVLAVVERGGAALRGGEKRNLL